MLALSLLSLAAFAVGSPVGTIEEYARSLDTRGGVSTQQMSSFQFYVQHAAAAYCNSETSPYSAITCKGSCNAVEASGAYVINSFTGRSTGIGGYVSVDHQRKEVVLAVRGSNNIRNFITDIIFAFQRCDLVSECKVHAGFAKAWDEISQPATAAIRSALADYPSYRTVVTGHSLGGAVATIAAAYIRRDVVACDVYTFGSPRPGNDHFTAFVTRQAGAEYRMTHEADPVPRLPPIIFGYRHTSPEYWLSSGRNDQNDYSISNVRICSGDANTGCNGGTFGLDIIAHLHYLGDISGCAGFPLNFKRDDDISDEDLKARLNKWSQQDQDFTSS